MNPLANKLLKGVDLLQLLLALAMLGVGPLLPGHSNWSIASMLVAGGLIMIFCAQEAVTDERVEQLKIKVAKVGLL